MQVTNDMSLLSLISHASVPVQLIMLMLLGISIMSWTYIFAKRLAIKRAHAQTRRFEDDFWSGGDLSMLQQAVASRRDEQGALARIFDAGMTEFLKARRGKLSFSVSPLSAIAAHGFRELPILAADAEASGALDWHHADPFDRLLVAQAQRASAILVTADAAIRDFGAAPMLWAVA